MFYMSYPRNVKTEVCKSEIHNILVSVNGIPVFLQFYTIDIKDNNTISTTNGIALYCPSSVSIYTP